MFALRAMFFVVQDFVAMFELMKYGLPHVFWRLRRMCLVLMGSDILRLCVGQDSLSCRC